MTLNLGQLLKKVDNPADLRKLEKGDLPIIADELRQYIIDVVSQKGGHLGASLGVVELTIALHYVFNTPDDQLIWDVGHQAYGHKILTGRREAFQTNRTLNGISGFPKRTESEYDTFGVGHSSTSISAALGMAMASQLKNDSDRNHIAVIGDGALTGGMAFEALNHGGSENANLLVVLNDNCMSIDPNVGALKGYLTDISKSQSLDEAKDDVWHLLGKISRFGSKAEKIASKVEKAVNDVLQKQSNFFESLNFKYYGPVDGHDLDQLTKVLEELKGIPGPKILHCLTRKGKGYLPAEKGNATKWHAPGLFDRETGKSLKKKGKAQSPPKYQDVFGHTIVELAKANEKIVGITPAMPTGSSLTYMMEEMPDRAFDVGIAEQHAVTLSAGMATQGLIPFCNIYSTFMQRAYDQIMHDVALQNLNVVFCLDRAGLVGADGPTHHGAFDIAYMRCLPNMIVSAPMNEEELRNLMYTAQNKPCGPFSIRYPRGKGVMLDWRKEFKEIEIGKGRKISEGIQLAILSIGHIGNEVKQAVNDLKEEGLSIAHYDLRFVKPLDAALLKEVFTTFDKVITVEDGCLQGGMGTAVSEFMLDNNFSSRIKRLGIPDSYAEHGTQQELYEICGYNAESIKRTCKDMLA